MGTKKKKKKKVIKEDDLFRTKPKKPNKKLYLILPIPISVNSAYQPRFVKRRYRGMVLSNDAQKCIKKIVTLVELEMQKQKYKKENKTVWQYLDLYFYMPDRLTRDSHNSIKVLMDSLQGLCFSNDYYIMPRVQLVEFDKQNPRLECVLSNQKETERVKHAKYICKERNKVKINPKVVK